MREKKKYKIQKLTSSVNSKNDDRSIQILICMTKGEEMVCRNYIDQRFKPGLTDSAQIRKS